MGYLRFHVIISILALLLTFQRSQALEDIHSYIAHGERFLPISSHYPHEAQQLEDLYARIHQAKWTGQVSDLLEIKEEFKRLSYTEEAWKGIALEVRWYRNCFYPTQQTHQEFVGAKLFYPLELTKFPLIGGDVYNECRGIVACIGIAAIFKNPYALNRFMVCYRDLWDKLFNFYDFDNHNVPAAKRFQNKYYARERKLKAEVAKMFQFKKDNSPPVEDPFSLYQQLIETGGPESLIKAENFKSANPEIYYRLGRQAERARNYLEAFDSYKRAMEVGYSIKGYYPMSFLLARVATELRKKGHFVLDEASIENLYILAGPDGYFRLAGDAVRNSDYEKAERYYFKAGEAGLIDGYMQYCRYIEFTIDDPKEARFPRPMKKAEARELMTDIYRKADLPTYAYGSEKSPGGLIPSSLRAVQRLIDCRDIYGYKRLYTMASKSDFNPHMVFLHVPELQRQNVAIDEIKTYAKAQMDRIQHQHDILYQVMEEVTTAYGIHDE